MCPNPALVFKANYTLRSITFTHMAIYINVSKKHEGKRETSSNAWMRLSGGGRTDAPSQRKASTYTDTVATLPKAKITH